MGLGGRERENEERKHVRKNEKAQALDFPDKKAAKAAVNEGGPPLWRKGEAAVEHGGLIAARLRRRHVESGASGEKRRVGRRGNQSGITTEAPIGVVC